VNVILYIGADPSHWLVLSKTLISRGFIIEVARDGLEGVRKARALQPDLILMDLFLVRMDSLDVIRQLKGCALTWDIPTIFVSAWPPDYSRWLARETGVQGVIAKPFGGEEILGIIRKYLPRRTGRFPASVVN
jgi:two-component system alkaline phosphatase synthesis response regulator PhoP